MAALANTICANEFARTSAMRRRSRGKSAPHRQNSPSLQPPDVPAPPLQKNTLGAIFVTRPLSLVYLTDRTCACFQNRVDEADEDDVAQQDHTSAYHLTPSAVTSES